MTPCFVFPPSPLPPHPLPQIDSVHIQQPYRLLLVKKQERKKENSQNIRDNLHFDTTILIKTSSRRIFPHATISHRQTQQSPIYTQQSLSHTQQPLRGQSQMVMKASFSIYNLPMLYI